MSETKHTKGKLRYEPIGVHADVGPYLIYERGNVMGKIFDEEDAHELVHRWNCYKGLVVVCRESLNAINTEHPIVTPTIKNQKLRYSRVLLKSAIAKAEPNKMEDDPLDCILEENPKGLFEDQGEARRRFDNIDPIKGEGEPPQLCHNCSANLKHPITCPFVSQGHAFCSLRCMTVYNNKMGVNNEPNN